MSTEPARAAISTSATRAAVTLLPSDQPRTNASTQTTTKNAAMTPAAHSGNATTSVRSKADPTRPDITQPHPDGERLWLRGAAEATLSKQTVFAYRSGSAASRRRRSHRLDR